MSGLAKGSAVQSRNGKPFKSILLRMPVELAQKVERFAQAGWRTQTAEIISRLEASFEGQSIDGHGVIVVQDVPKNK